ncbi:MAG: amidophosphoribosyltransferase [Candidatus Doudnabacteria bacterium CG10_big_fil_rev_8_21_14_0_10_42_18]|uniref:Amidophosphoribosyltransferase n=1 Tax=Candidatus Doudnabacteria bacterium CG10_big_fil_rev_8_21_14_0_10_42_18 TaxID=1974552 RepID=A0A2H0VBX5_9BACT|nr:MAG: amidophosphoribosyltransferase [Candidatus Doudnabacteria bacterium CG10_big_fil_rev_8_21_14_0_10_42_18]
MAWCIGWQKAQNKKNKQTEDSGELGEKCGVFGVYGKNLDVARLTFFGLYSLQHRGQESSGIAVGNGYNIDCYKNTGLVAQVFKEETIQNLKGFVSIGHNRYSTSHGTGLKHAQPVIVRDGALALAHNGNLPSISALKEFLEGKDISTHGCNDSELMAKAIGYYLEHKHSLADAIKKAYPLFTGAFSLLVMTKNEIAAVRDSYGIRPLCMGKLNGGYVIASESCALKTVGSNISCEIQPGELVTINEKGISHYQITPSKPKVDIFEFVYFARPDSEISGQSVYQVRKRCGMELAKEFKMEADMIVPVPETAYPVAFGYSQSTGIPVEQGLIKNRYIHRTFIEPEQHAREKNANMKLNAMRHVLLGKRVILIDDSIVRGTTSKNLIGAIFKAGAEEVHFLVSSPPVMYPDFYGIDTPRQKDLIGANKSVKEIKQFLGATSLYYLSLEGLIKATGIPKNNLCTSCFTGEYPIDIKEKAEEIKKVEFEKAAA